MNLPLLLVITGPVGGGKSTVAKCLADLLRAAGLETAVIDLDVVYCMARQVADFGNHTTWRAARQGAAALAETFYANGIQAVIVEGGFLSALEHAQLREHVHSQVQEHFVTLLVSAPKALQRAQDDPDPGRVASRLPDVQALLYAEFEAALPYLTSASTVIPADDAEPDALARLILEHPHLGMTT